MGANRKFNEVPTKATIVPADEVVLVDSEDSLKLKRVSATVFKGADGAQGPQGPQGIPGTPGTGTVVSVVGGTSISVNSTDPANPVVSISLGADENFVTDAEKAKLANTSGVNTGDQDLSGLAPLAGATFTGDVVVPDEAYDATTWNGNNEVPTKNAIRDKIESMSGGGGGPSPILTYSTSGVAIAGKVASVRLSQACTFSKLAISLGVLPVGGNFEVSVKKNGTTILSGNLTITTTETASNSYYTVITGDAGKSVISTTTAVAEDVITCEIIAGIGNTFLGADVNIVLTGTLANKIMNDFVIPDRRGLVAEYLLNGNTKDTSGNGYDGTPLNVTYSKTDRGYQTYKGYFAGGSSSSMIVNSGFPAITSSFTVQLLIANDNLSQSGTYVYEKGHSGAGNQHAILYGYVANSYEFYSSVFRGGTITCPDNKPHLITYTYDGSTFSAYLDSKLVSSVSASFSLNYVDGAFVYGQTNGYGSGTSHYGQSIRFFNRALSETEIRNWYLESLRALGGSTLSGLMSGVIAYYDFRGDANDIVGGYDGTVSGATLTTDRFGNANSAFLFDGNDYITGGTGSAITGDFAIETWCEFSSLTGNQMVASFGNEANGQRRCIWLTDFGGKFISFNGYNADVVGTTVATTNTPYHILISRIGSTVTIYVNGVSAGSGTPSLASFTQTALTIGANNANTENLIGKTDFVQLYDKGKTADEAKALYYLRKSQYLIPFA